jgi:hypothetical protein
MDSIIRALFSSIPSLYVALGQLLALTSSIPYLLYFLKSTFTTTIQIPENDFLALYILEYCGKRYDTNYRTLLITRSYQKKIDDEDNSDPLRGVRDIAPKQQKINDDEDISDLLKGVRNFAQEQQKTQPKYRPGFSNR